MESVRVGRDLPGAPDGLFEWFVDAALLTAWWPDEAETDPAAGGAYRMHWAGPGVTLRGTYVAVERPDRLAFTWSWDHDDLPPREVVVTFVASSAGTSVTVDHEAATADEGADYADGWTFFLDRLATRLSGG
ncbi:SRPBCC family protein [Ilumatobacter sp.]|uniref:SRPBCC family protein n=1 Tax=Ilumatobacter sp. TaxID=1967498 RepID=UPI003AF57F97